MIVATGPGHPGAAQILGEIGVGAWRARLADAEALIVRGDVDVTTDDLDAAPKLRVIGRSGVGVDRVDVEAARARGIPVVVTPGANARAVAEGALTLALALLKRVPESIHIKSFCKTILFKSFISKICCNKSFSCQVKPTKERIVIVNQFRAIGHVFT